MKSLNQFPPKFSFKPVKRVLALWLLIAGSVVGAAAQSDAKTAVVFKSDGCSMFPDGNYRLCCVEHDKAYFVGGTWRERRRADNRLFSCVAAQRKFYNKLIAPLMWLGVRTGGVAFLPTPFRWGFGRPKNKKGIKSSDTEQIRPKTEYE